MRIPGHSDHRFSIQIEATAASSAIQASIRPFRRLSTSGFWRWSRPLCEAFFFIDQELGIGRKKVTFKPSEVKGYENGLIRSLYSLYRITQSRCFHLSRQVMRGFETGSTGISNGNVSTAHSFLLVVYLYWPVSSDLSSHLHSKGLVNLDL